MAYLIPSFDGAGAAGGGGVACGFAELAGGSGLPPVEKIRRDFDWMDRRIGPERLGLVAILNIVVVG